MLKPSLKTTWSTKSEEESSCMNIVLYKKEATYVYI